MFACARLIIIMKCEVEEDNFLISVYMLIMSFAKKKNVNIRYDILYAYTSKLHWSCAHSRNICFFALRCITLKFIDLILMKEILFYI